MKDWGMLLKFGLKIFLICSPVFIILLLLSGVLAITFENITILFGEPILIILLSLFLMAFGTIYAGNYFRRKR